MSAKPTALVISVAEDDPSTTVKMMLGVEDLPEAIVLDHEIHAYPLNIDTKYYSADIHLCAMRSKNIGSKEFAEGVGATIIKFDSEKENSLQEVESWLPFIKEISPEVLILLCERCLETSESGSSRMDVQRWCVENRFELVELNPEDDSDEEEEDMALPGLAVTTGIKRVMQALQSHLWPNMDMKDKSNHINPALAAYINGSAAEDPVAELSDNIQELSVENRNSSMMQRIDQLLGAEDENMGLENLEMAPEMEFANLLSRLNEVKEQASTMPNDQRKMCAEQVVKAFWNAIGGDEDEIFDEMMQEFNAMGDD